MEAQISSLEEERSSWAEEYEDMLNELEIIQNDPSRQNDPSQQRKIDDLNHSIAQTRDVITDLEARRNALKDNNVDTRHNLSITNSKIA